MAILVLGYCGLRWCELAALRVGSIDFLRRKLNVAEAVTEVHGRLFRGTPKTHETRSVPIPRVLIDDLASHVEGKPATTSYSPPPRARRCATGTRAGRGSTPPRPRSASPAWTPHELRHTAASLAVSAGANVKAVQAMLGHASAAMTLDTYADLFDNDLGAVADRLDAVVHAAGGRLADSVRTGDQIAALPSAIATATAQQKLALLTHLWVSRHPC